MLARKTTRVPTHDEPAHNESGAARGVGRGPPGGDWDCAGGEPRTPTRGHTHDEPAHNESGAPREFARRPSCESGDEPVGQPRMMPLAALVAVANRFCTSSQLTTFQNAFT